MLDAKKNKGILQPYLGNSNVRWGEFNLADLAQMRFEADEEERYGLRPGDLVLCEGGEPGRCAIWNGPAGMKFQKALHRIRPKSTFNNYYLFSWFCYAARAGQLDAHFTGTTIKHLTGKAVAELRVPLPPLGAQQAMVDVLKPLDYRIALLRETNTTLEAIAQALFKSWFVDFDPVRAKSQGLAPAGMDEATSALFPDGFDEARRGPVPRGWTEASIYEVAQVVYGAPFASSRFNTDGIGRPLVRIRDLRDEAPGVHTDEVHPKGYLLTPGDIVVGMDGEFRAYLWGGERAWLNQRVCVFRPKAGVPAAFVRATIEPQLAHIEATETATTVIHLGKGDIDRFAALVPPDDVLAAFGAVADPLYARIVANKQACRSLAAIRDTLLPRLISGQLRLPDVVEAEAALA